MNNKLIEMGGLATVILKVRTPFCLNGKEYEVGDILTIFEDAIAMIDYNTSSREENLKIKNTNLFNYYSYQINLIDLSSISLTTEMMNLFSKYNADSFTIPNIEISAASDGNLYPLKTPDKLKPAKIISTNVLLEHQQGLLYNEFLEDNKEYSFLYYSTQDGDYFELGSNNRDHMPYLSMEIIVKGNIDKKTSYTYLFFDKVDLEDLPTLDVVDGSTNKIRLRFKVLDGNNFLGVS